MREEDSAVHHRGSVQRQVDRYAVLLFLAAVIVSTVPGRCCGYVMPQEQLIGGDAHVERPHPGGFLQIADVVGAEVVQARLDDGTRHVRTEMRAEPGGGSWEATMT